MGSLVIPHRHSPRGYGGVLALLSPQHHWGAVSPLPHCLQPQSPTHVSSMHPFVCLSILKMLSRKHGGAVIRVNALLSGETVTSAVKGQGGGGGRGATWGAGEGLPALTQEVLQADPSPALQL